MKTTISITLDTEDAGARSILSELLSQASRRNPQELFLALSAMEDVPEGNLYREAETGLFYIHVADRGEFYDPLNVLKLREDTQRENMQDTFADLTFLPASESEHKPVREFDPIEVRSRHLEVIQRLKKGKASARQLAPKLRGHWTQQEVSNSLAYLKRLGLVERQVGSRYWVATAKAKAHPLVAA